MARDYGPCNERTQAQGTSFFPRESDLSRVRASTSIVEEAHLLPSSRAVEVGCTHVL